MAPFCVPLPPMAAALALAETALPGGKQPLTRQAIVSRKGILELQRILTGEGDVELKIGTNHSRHDRRRSLTSKLIDGKFPEYGRVIPANPTRIITADRELLWQALQRTAILSNEKYRGVRLTLSSGQLNIQAHNPEQEEAEDQIEVDFKGDALEIGFNVACLLDALAAIGTESVELGLTDASSSCLLRAPGANVLLVVVPMRLDRRRRRCPGAGRFPPLHRARSSRARAATPVIQGANGSGKTSLLEAMFVLGRVGRLDSKQGASAHDAQRLQLFARELRDPDHRIGFGYDTSGEPQARLDGRTPATVAELPAFRRGDRSGHPSPGRKGASGRRR